MASSAGPKPPIFSYWCRFYGENPDERAESIKLVEPKIYNALENKATVSKLRYILLGIDLLRLENGDVKFIEVNAIPNFIHSKKVNQALNVPFFEHTMRVIYGLGSDRLIQVKKQVQKTHIT